MRRRRVGHAIEASGEWEDDREGCDKEGPTAGRDGEHSPQTILSVPSALAIAIGSKTLGRS